MLERSIHRSRFATWSFRVGFFVMQLLVVTLVLHRFADLPTPVAINLAKVAFAGSVLAILLAILGFFRIWTKGYHGVTRGMLGLIIALGILAWPAAVLPAYLQLPALHDITTDPVKPPRFQALAARPALANPPEYPGLPAALEQAESYPDIKPLNVQRPPLETFEIIQRVLEREGLAIVRSLAPDGAVTIGVIEAVDETLILGFDDDVIVRVAATTDGTRVDLRSASRYGKHDFGRNATRVRDLLKLLQARLDIGAQPLEDDKDKIAKSSKKSKKKTGRASTRKRARNKRSARSTRRASQSRARQANQRARARRAARQARARRRAQRIFQQSNR